MDSSQKWLLFSYSVPKEPSTVRVGLWRRLRDLGALYVAPSVCVLPDTPDAASKLAVCRKAAEEAGGAARLLPLVVVDESAEAELLADFQALRATYCEGVFFTHELAALSRQGTIRC